MQQECHAELFHQARAVVGCGAVHTQTDRHAELEHFRNPGNAGGKLHVGNRAVADAGAGFSEKLELFGVEMNAVCVPHVRTDPAERLHERQRAHAFALEHVVFFVPGLAQVRMQPDMVLPGENGALAQELGRNRKRRAGSQRHLAHGAEGSIMIGFDQARGVLHNFVYCLHHGIGGKAAVLDGQIHGAA